ncbi:MAG: DUF2892 domain-containing protein [Actinobacteria bacterium]|nr:DUF2892 domain-containing protein [Actinomycetota bacterium]
MKLNEGIMDRRIRGFVLAPVALILGVVALALGWPLWLGIVLLVVGAAMAGTAAIGVCPAYLPFGISTCRTDTAH